MSWRMRSHTADARATLDAPSLEALYADAVDLVRHLVVGDSPVRAKIEVVVQPDGDTDEERFFRFVRELLFLNDHERFVPGVLVALAPPTVSGETFEAGLHSIEHGVKALTRHRFRFERVDDGYHADMVFDL